MDNKDNINQEPIRIVVTGPHGSGKTALVTLIAEMVAGQGFGDIKIVHPEVMPNEMREKAAALVAGQMNQVLVHPVEISECGPLRYNPNNPYEFSGNYPPVPGTNFLYWLRPSSVMAPKYGSPEDESLAKSQAVTTPGMGF